MIRTEEAIKLLKQKNKCAFFTSLIIVLICLSNRSDSSPILKLNTRLCLYPYRTAKSEFISTDQLDVGIFFRIIIIKVP